MRLSRDSFDLVIRPKLVFFSMPFGVKTVEGRTHDFDTTWRELLHPALPEAWEGIRIDAADPSGSIPERSKHYLRTADVAVFDLTTSNPNVLYSLGVRDVFVPARRVLIACEGSTPPFELERERVLSYPAALPRALESGFREQLQAMIVEAGGPADLESTARPPLRKLKAQLERARTVSALVAVWESWKPHSTLPVDLLLDLAKAFSEHRRLDLALQAAHRAYKEDPKTWDVARTLGWYLGKSGQMEEAVQYYRQSIAWNPADIEAMGMLAGIYKRFALQATEQGDVVKAKEWFGLSKESYSLATKVDPHSVYHALNLGALSFIDGVRDSNAGYAKVIELVGPALANASTWDVLSLGEAYLLTSNFPDAFEAFSLATRREDFSQEMKDSVLAQLALLERFELSTEHAHRVRSILRGESAQKLPGLIIIHLSDVHFGRKPSGGTEGEMHRFRTKGALHNNTPLADHILKECERERTANHRIIVVISGDIAYQATKDEYDQAFEFVERLRQGLDLPRHHVILVPGNHDVNWRLSAHDSSTRFDDFLKFARKVFGGTELLKGLYPYLTWDFDVESKRPEPKEILSVHVLKEHGIVFIGFNSCVVEDHNLHFGAIGAAQLNLAADALQKVDPSWLRIAVMHHHVLPLDSMLPRQGDGTSMDGTIVHDYGIVEHRLHQLGFDMLLHGHKHEPGVRISKLVSAYDDTNWSQSKSIIVCGAGSAGVEESELPQSWGNHFAIYRIPEGRRRRGSPFVEIEWRELPYNDLNVTWISKRKWMIEG